MVKALLAAGADACSRAHDGRSALHPAAKLGKDEIVSALLDTEISLNEYDEEGQTPLMCAVKAGHSSVANTLLAAGVDIKAG